MYLPPLDPSSIPRSSSVTPKRKMMLQRCQRGGSKLRKLNEGNAILTDSNITQGNDLVSQPEAGGLVPDTTEEETQKVSAKEQLYRLCCVRHWKPPVYECSDNEGPCHRKLFTGKVTTEIKEDSRIMVLECFGDPQHKKKIAFEQAAEAALWYLKNVGYALQTDNPPGSRG